MVHKIGKRLYYAFMLKGVRYRGVIPEALIKAQAEKAEVRIRNDIFEGNWGNKAESTRFSDFVEKVYLPWAMSNKKSCKDDVMNTKVLLELYKEKTFAQISPLLIEKFKVERKHSMTRYKRQRTPASVDRELATLSKIFSLAIYNGILESNPCRRVKKLREDNERKRYLTFEEEERLMAALTGRRAHLKPLVVLAIHTGMRKGELLSLKWSNVDFQRGAIHVTHTKNGRDRDVPMNSQARKVLLELQSKSEGEYVFENGKTGTSLTTIKTGFRSACEDAEIYDFRFHDLRHTTGTRMADAGADAFVIR
jgi:integrase